MYRRFDANHNGLDFNEYHRCVKALFNYSNSKAPCPEILEEYFYEFDYDESGKLNFKEFKKLMKALIKDYKKHGKEMYGHYYSSGEDCSDFSDF